MQRAFARSGRGLGDTRGRSSHRMHGSTDPHGGDFAGDCRPVTLGRVYYSQIAERSRTMTTITTKDGTEIYYKDWGEGPVVTFSHGWPLNADAWDGQMHY